MTGFVATLARTGPHTFGAILGVRAAIAERPRHLVLAALIAGLLVGPLWPPGVLVGAAMALGLGGRASIALLAAASVLSGAVLAQARLAALEAGSARGMAGTAVVTRAILLEPARERPTGLRAARVRLLDGPAARAMVAARVKPGTRWPPGAQVGDVVAIRGRLVPLARYETYQRRRGAALALEVQTAEATGSRRAGLPGLLDGVRRRAERALAAGVPAPEAALLRGMVLGQDEAIEEPVREEFRRSGLAHLLRVRP